jgi:D-alanine--poly(phosphoribitol) ligase subunit 1
MTDLPGRLLTAAEARPDRPALWVDGETYSYRQLFALAGGLAAALASHEETFCVVYCAKNLTRYVAILASVLAGKVFVPLCPTSPPAYCERIVRLLDGRGIAVLDSGSEARDELMRSLVSPSWPVVASGSLRTAMHGAGPESPDRAQDGAYLMFTSGSTGTPKAVLVTRHNLTSYLDGATELFQPTPEDRFAQVNNFTFDLAMHDTAPFKLPSLLHQHRVTFWLSVPTTGLALAALGLLDPGSLPDLRCTCFCGEPLPNRLARQWHLAAPRGRLFNIYGPTECTIAVTAFEWRPDEEYPDVVPIGWPYPNQSVCMVDDSLREVPPGAIGELCIQGSQTVPGYHGDAEKTAARFVALPGRDGVWYRTGDWVHEDRWGLQFDGRRDDQLQVRGIRVERLEIETLTRNVLRTDSLAVVGWPVQDGHVVQGLALFVGEPAPPVPEIRRRICQELPEHMWPGQIVIGELPRTASGKVDYTELRRRLAAAADEPAPARTRSR